MIGREGEAKTKEITVMMNINVPKSDKGEEVSPLINSQMLWNVMQT